MKCDRMYGQAPQKECQGSLIEIAKGRLIAYICLTCNTPSLRCVCGGYMRHRVREDVLKCGCGNEIALSNENPKQMEMFH